MQHVARVHVITDSLSIVDAVVAAGAPAVQIRAGHDRTDRQVYQLALAAARRCRAAGVACLVDDRVDVAAAVAAETDWPVGAHVGAHDLPVPAARAVLGPGAPLGATARDAATAAAHRAAGADYVGVGPVYATATKDGLPSPLGLPSLAEIVAAAGIPVIAIGGIGVERAAAARSAGAHGVAVVGAVASAADPGAATRRLLAAVGAPDPSGVAR